MFYKKLIKNCSKSCILILITFLTFFSCKSKEEKYLKDHKVILCYTLNDDKNIIDQALEFEKNSKIKFKDASNIYIDYLREKKEIKETNYDKIIYPKLIIDGNYVYSFINMKTLDIAVFGLWINSENGEISHQESKLWINERDIIDFYKK